ADRLQEEFLSPGWGSTRDPNGGIRHFLGARTYGGRRVPADAYEKAKRQWDKLRTARSLGARPRSGGGSVTSLSGVVWQAIGPAPFKDGNSLFNRRVNSIAVLP